MDFRFAALPLVLATPVAAQSPAPRADCTRVRTAIPAALKGWSSQIPVSAGTQPGDGATLEPGQAVMASLHPAKHLALSPAPNRHAAPDGNGGTLSLAIRAPGTYRIALGESAVLDLVAGGKPVVELGQAQGPRCSGIRRLVDFRLAAGNYTIQLSGSVMEGVPLMVAKL